MIAKQDQNDIAATVRQKALDLGFSACGFSPVDSLEEHRSNYLDWLAAGYHGDMKYLERNIDVRFDPQKLVPNAKTVVSLLAAYHSDEQFQDGNPRISTYALGNDYHHVLRRLGNELMLFVENEIAPHRARFFTDSAPLMEREWAKRAGLGWVGKNGCLINGKSGSWYFIAEMITDLDIREENTEQKNLCVNCTRCIDACPTQALLGEGRINATRCISYLTIEQQSPIPESFKNRWSDWIFGCDICQEVCPWNHKPEQGTISELLPNPRLQELDWDDYRHMTPELFDEIFSASPVLRARFDGLSRNIAFIDSSPDSSV